MSNYQRLISYIYTYEGGIKGKNIGFAKLETRGNQCRIAVNVKKIFVGGNPLGVYLLTGQEEVKIGTLFARNGAGEFRAVVNSLDVENSGRSLEDFFGLSVHDVESAWRCYTTIWEDAVAHAAEVELADVTAENAAKKETVSEGIEKTPEILPISREIERQLEADVTVRETEAKMTEERLEHIQETLPEEVSTEIPRQDTSKVHIIRPERAGAEPAEAKVIQRESLSRGARHSGSVRSMWIQPEQTAKEADMTVERSEVRKAAELEAKTEMQVEGQSEMRSSAQSEMQPGPQTVIQPEEQLEMKPEVQSAIWSESQLELQSMMQSESQSMMQSEQSESQSVIQSESQSVRQSETQSVRQSETQSVRQSEAQSVRQSETQPVIQSELQPAMQAGIQPDTPLETREEGLTETPGTLEEAQRSAQEEMQERATAHAAMQGRTRSMNQRMGRGNSGFNMRSGNLRMETLSQESLKPAVEPDLQKSGLRTPELQPPGIQTPGPQPPELLNQEPDSVKPESEQEIPVQSESADAEPPSGFAQPFRNDQDICSEQEMWEKLRKRYPKILAFDYADGCEVLTVKPQDIGLLPRETWVYGNNSFLLHGYYNYRYLILAKLNNPKGRCRYLLGVPGHYFSNEKYMASMFGFSDFVLSKKQPSRDGRFGYWYTDVKIGE